jgi:hypothetical protein
MEKSVSFDTARDALDKIKDRLEAMEYRDAMDWCIQLLEDLSYLEQKQRESDSIA